MSNQGAYQADPKLEQSRRSYRLPADTLPQFSGSESEPPEAESLDPRAALPNGLTDVAKPYWRKLAERIGHQLALDTFELVGMVDHDLKSFWRPTMVPRLSRFQV